MKLKGFLSSRREKERADFKESEFYDVQNMPDSPDKDLTDPPDTPVPPTVPPRLFPDLREAFNKITDAVNKNYNDRNQTELGKARDEIREALSAINIMAFIGSRGTGKSTRAIKVAKDENIPFIIDDGLLINGGRVVAGLSAKRAGSKLESVRQALFIDENRAEVMRRALAENLPEKLMILGTSDGMLEKICNSLWLPLPSRVIRIEDVTTEEERRKAVFVRSTQGRHTIPVPSMEIKHEFSGYFADPLNRILRRRERSSDQIEGYSGNDRTVVRPTFSTIGSYSISNQALSDIAGIIIRRRVKGAGEILKFDTDKESYGVVVNMEISVVYGYNAQEVLREVQERVTSGIEDLTAMNVVMVNIKAKRVVRPDKLQTV